MPLTPAQKTTLKADILANSDANTIYENGDLSALASLYNLAASPEFVVWKTKVMRQEILQNGFDWTRLDNLSVGLARVWDSMFFDTGSLNPSKANVRAGIEEVWKGTAADLAVRAAVYVHCKRPSTRIERLFATGTGSTAVPGLLVYEGPLGFGDLIGL